MKNVDLSSVRVSGIHMRANSQEIPQLTVTEISFEIIYVNFHSNLPGAQYAFNDNINNPRHLYCVRDIFSIHGESDEAKRNQ